MIQGQSNYGLGSRVNDLEFQRLHPQDKKYFGELWDDQTIERISNGDFGDGTDEM